MKWTQFILICIIFLKFNVSIFSQEREMNPLFLENTIVISDYSVCNNLKYFDTAFVVHIDADSIIDIIVDNLKTYGLNVERLDNGRNLCEYDLSRSIRRINDRPNKWWRGYLNDTSLTLVPFIRIYTEVISDKLFRLENKNLIPQFFKRTSIQIEFTLIGSKKRVFRKRIFSNRYLIVDEVVYASGLEYFPVDIWSPFIFELITNKVYTREF